MIGEGDWICGALEESQYVSAMKITKTEARNPVFRLCLYALCDLSVLLIFLYSPNAGALSGFSLFTYHLSAAERLSH